MGTEVPTIACVLRSGGDFTPLDVEKLKAAINRLVLPPYRFLCLTDTVGQVLSTVPCNVRKLSHNYPGWWSKIELFKLTGPVLYFDLDTVLVKSIQPLLDLIEEVSDGEFYMLRAFNEDRDFASGVMAWHGDFSFVYTEFEKSHMEQYRWDQRYIVSKLREHNVSVQGFQHLVDGIYSYKRHIRGNSIPEDARVICFHGKPRPSEVEL